MGHSHCRAKVQLLSCFLDLGMGSVSEINTIGSLSLGEDKEKPHGEESAWQERRGDHRENDSREKRKGGRG